MTSYTFGGSNTINMISGLGWGEVGWGAKGNDVLIERVLMHISVEICESDHAFPPPQPPPPERPSPCLIASPN